MGRKSFLSRVDSGRAISTSGKSTKEADNFIKGLNKACGELLQFLIQRIPGMHNTKIVHKERQKKRKHSGIAGRIAG